MHVSINDARHSHANSSHLHGDLTTGLVQERSCGRGFVRSGGGRGTRGGGWRGAWGRTRLLHHWVRSSLADACESKYSFLAFAFDEPKLRVNLCFARRSQINSHTHTALAGLGRRTTLQADVSLLTPRSAPGVLHLYKTKTYVIFFFKVNNFRSTSPVVALWLLCTTCMNTRVSHTFQYFLPWSSP